MTTWLHDDDYVSRLSAFELTEPCNAVAENVACVTRQVTNFNVQQHDWSLVTTNTAILYDWKYEQSLGLAIDHSAEFFLEIIMAK